MKNLFRKESMENMIVQAIRQELTIEQESTLEIHSSLLGSGKGCFSSPKEVDAFIHGERATEALHVAPIDRNILISRWREIKKYPVFASVAKQSSGFMSCPERSLDCFAYGSQRRKRVSRQRLIKAAKLRSSSVRLPDAIHLATAISQ